MYEDLNYQLLNARVERLEIIIDLLVLRLQRNGDSLATAMKDLEEKILKGKNQ